MKTEKIDWPMFEDLKKQVMKSHVEFWKTTDHYHNDPMFVGVVNTVEALEVRNAELLEALKYCYKQFTIRNSITLNKVEQAIKNNES